MGVVTGGGRLFLMTPHWSWVTNRTSTAGVSRVVRISHDPASGASVRVDDSHGLAVPACNLSHAEGCRCEWLSW